MIHNLSKRERNLRLAFGLLLIGGSAITYVTNYGISLSSTFAVAGAALILNYVTCFCGAKKAVKIAKNQIYK